MKILILLRKNGNYGGYTATTNRSGLLNSAELTAKALEDNFKGVETKVVIIDDSNSIDREVTLFKPDVCILHAIWVLPEKMEHLTFLHPSVLWIIRVHSEIPFLANEGESISRIFSLNKIPNVGVSFNSNVTAKNFINTYEEYFSYLPNIYSEQHPRKINFLEQLFYQLDLLKYCPEEKYINIGCFGAIRPMKNQLLQAFAAITFGNLYNQRVNFYINSGRVEQRGESVLKNIRALFKAHPQHELIEIEWLDRKSFLEIIPHMDLGMQLSMSESFNIVTADFVDSDVPIIVSPAIEWMPSPSIVDSEDVKIIAKQMARILANVSYICKINTNALDEYNKKAIGVWAKYIK